VSAPAFAWREEAALSLVLLRGVASHAAHPLSHLAYSATRRRGVSCGALRFPPRCLSPHTPVTTNTSLCVCVRGAPLRELPGISKQVSLSSLLSSPPLLSSCHTHHGEGASALVLECEVLVRELGAVDGLAARAVAAREVTRLRTM
jgi:hypothetical protein